MRTSASVNDAPKPASTESSADPMMNEAPGRRREDDCLRTRGDQELSATTRLTAQKPALVFLVTSHLIPLHPMPAMSAALKAKLEPRAWSLFVLWTAAVSFPFVVTYAAIVSLWHRLTQKPTVYPKPTRTAIVTGGKMTKALCVCRHLKRAGCRVVLIETHKYWMVASRFADCVDRFVTVAVPEQHPQEYRRALKVLAYEEEADIFVPGARLGLSTNPRCNPALRPLPCTTRPYPDLCDVGLLAVSSPVASAYDATIASVLPPGCQSLSLGEAVTSALDDKVIFHDLAKSCGLTVPDTRRMCSKADVHAFNDELRAKGPGATRYVLKNLAYDSMRRLDLFTLPAE